jgi:hypothetical protein
VVVEDREVCMGKTQDQIHKGDYVFSNKSEKSILQRLHRKLIHQLVAMKIKNFKEQSSDWSSDDVNGIIYSKPAQKYFGAEVEALKSIEEAVRQKSVKILKTNIQKFQDFLLNDDIIIHHLQALQNDLTEKNFIKIILGECKVPMLILV